MERISVVEISVVMPVYNGEKYLVEAIESILNQSFKQFEFIIIDDGSTDGSFNIISDYAKLDSRVKMIRRENKGLIFSLNEGIGVARGRYIARMDADDISHPERFNFQKNLLDSGVVDICGCHYHVIDKGGNFVDSAIVPLTRSSFTTFIAQTTPWAHGSIMMKADLFNSQGFKYGSSKYKTAEDYALWVQMISAGVKFGNVDMFLFQYRHFTSSLSNLNANKSRIESKKISHEFINKNKEILVNSLMEIGRNEHEISYREEELLVKSIFHMAFRALDLRLFLSLRKTRKRSLMQGFIRYLANV